jgi:hypothetical protein
LIEVKATINSNAWKVVGANPAPSNFDSPINLRDEIGLLMCGHIDLMTNNFVKNNAICDFKVSICFESNNQLKDGLHFAFDSFKM